MPTPAQIGANRANAQFSTGPRTSSGRERASLNALKWGLTGRTVVIPGEDMQNYEAFRQKWSAELKPVGFKEEEYLRTIVDCKWRLNRIRAAEDSTFALGRDANYRDIYNPTADQAVADAATLKQASKILDNLSRHEARLSREFSKTMKTLEDTQAARKAQEKAALEQAIALYKLQKMLDEPFNPREFGFELSLPEIERHAHLTGRLHQAESARKCGYNKQKYLAAAATATA